MEKNHALSELMKTTLENVRSMADANTIIGTPIVADGVTLIPVSRMSFGVAGGGTEFSTKKQVASDANFGGGSGASAKLEPVAFLVVRDGNVKLLPVAPPPATTVDRVIETVPEVVDKVTVFIENQQAKKAQKAAEEAACSASDFAE
ncbi:MAG: GerW family sporulation protein [Oscillospiraceae bacterium]|nr:GerW family sporulation protein [Oscillospiraceae bacterium]